MEQDGTSLPPSNEDTNAQVEQAQAQTADTSQQDSQAGQPANPGLQKRIDELVAQQHEYRRMFEAERQQNQELLAVLVQGQRPKPQDPYAGVELDPDDKRKIESVFAPMMNQVLERQRRTEEMLVQSQAREVAAQYGDSRVTALAEKLAATWTQRGLAGWTPADAADMALAQVIKEDRAKQANTARTQPRTADPDVLTQQSRAGAPRGRSRPANFDSLSTEQKLSIWEAEGLDDVPF